MVDLTGANLVDADAERLLEAVARAGTRLRVLRLAANVRLSDATAGLLVSAAAAGATAQRGGRRGGEAGDGLSGSGRGGIADGRGLLTGDGDGAGGSGSDGGGGDGADETDGGSPFGALVELDLSATGLTAAGFRALAAAAAAPPRVSGLGGLRLLAAAYNGFGEGGEGAMDDLAAGVAALLGGGEVAELRLERNLLCPAFLVRLAARAAGRGGVGTGNGSGGGEAARAGAPPIPPSPPPTSFLGMGLPLGGAHLPPCPSSGGGGLTTLSLAANADRAPTALLEAPASVAALAALAAGAAAGRGRLATLDVRACGAEAHPGGRAAVVAAMGAVGGELGLLL